MQILTPELLIEQFTWTLWIKTTPTRIKIIDAADIQREHSFLDLEGREHEVKLGRCICVGSQGERWTCSLASLNQDRYPVTEPDAQGYRAYQMRNPCPVACVDLPFPFLLLVHDQHWHSEETGGVVTWNEKMGMQADMRLVARTIFYETYEPYRVQKRGSV